MQYHAVLFAFPKRSVLVLWITMETARNRVMPGKLNNHCSESALSGDLIRVEMEPSPKSPHLEMIPPERGRQRDLHSGSGYFHPPCGREIIPPFTQWLDKSERSQSKDHKHLGTVCLALV